MTIGSNSRGPVLVIDTCCDEKLYTYPPDPTYHSQHWGRLDLEPYNAFSSPSHAYLKSSYQHTYNLRITLLLYLYEPLDLLATVLVSSRG